MRHPPNPDWTVPSIIIDAAWPGSAAGLHSIIQSKMEVTMDKRMTEIKERKANRLSP
jgi:hypothetical protein